MSHLINGLLGEDAHNILDSTKFILGEAEKTYIIKS